jgi:leucyl/phenylalanyl-tRNA--protein transferase
VTVDEDFEGTIRACGETRAETGTWITPALLAGYLELHALGWAHSVEVWDTRTTPRRQVGGIYGIAIGGAFAGESMFHKETDCSKIAFAGLVERLRAGGFVLFDVQVQNRHLASLGCIEVPRPTYLDRLDAALRVEARLT